MSALDIAARGLAGRALATLDDTAQGVVSLRSRAEPTAAALEALARDNPALSGFAGDVHCVETTPFPRRNGLVLYGNGAELRNVNPADLGLSDRPLAALALGDSTAWSTPTLDYFPLVSAMGPQLALAPGAGSNFAPGDLVVIHGASEYQTSDYLIYHNYCRAKVVAADADSVTVDRALPPELIADAPVIGNVEQGVAAGFEGPDRFFLLHSPHISNITLASDGGEAWKWGGVIDGTFRDITCNGRNGLVFNAMQHCLFENLRFTAWRKICELAEGSYGTTVRNLQGVLGDASTKSGGGADTAPFFIGITENSSRCVLENLDVDSGPNDATAGIACQIVGGHDNEIRYSTMSFPAHRTYGLSVTSQAEAGNGSVDCGYRDVRAWLPQCAVFFSAKDLGGGLVRPYFIDCRFHGTPSSGIAGEIGGDGATVRNVWCENGAASFLPGCVNATVEDCYFPEGFANLTPAMQRANPGVCNNDSAANRRLNAAAVYTDTAQVAVSETTANQVYRSATFAPGDLKPGDVIHVYADANTLGGTSTRSCRISITTQGTTVGFNTGFANANSKLGIVGEITITSDTLIGYRVDIAGTVSEYSRAVSSLDVNGLTVNLEFWASTAAEPVYVRRCCIVPAKPGMRHLPLR